MNLGHLQTCIDSTAQYFGIFTLDVAPALLFYSYIPVSVLILIIGFFVWVKDSYSTRSAWLLILSIVSVLFLLNEIVLWTAVPAGFIYTSWALSMLLRVAVFLSVLTFLYIYIKKQYPPFRILLIGSVLILPILLLLPTHLNVEAIDVVECVGINGPLWLYLYALEFIAVVVVFFWAAKTRWRINHGKTDVSKVSYYLLVGAFILLLYSFVSEFAGEFTGIYEINLIGPVGTLVFIAVLAYAIVSLKAFAVKLIGAQALIFAIIALVGSQLFFIQSHVNFLLTSATLVATIIAGYYLVRSVKQEVKQREEIQNLVGELAKTNKRLQQLDKLKSEFVSIASHQLRSPLAAIMGYSSMLADGSYGKLPAKAEEVAARIEKSAKLMGSSVEDYLNVSRIEAGHMKYNLTDFNLKEQAQRVADDIRPLALKKNIILLFRSAMKGEGVVKADIGKTEQIMHNLINNSLKYTETGNITVVARDDVAAKKIYIDITDTGIGMSEETRNSIFQKFERGSNANTTNIHGTGLGLYTAAKLAEAMGGSVTAYSEGEGKGSRFTIEFPMIA